MWQTTFYTQHELTSICRTLDAASSSCLESVFGSYQKHWTAIDTFPKEGKESSMSTPFIRPTKFRHILKKGNKIFPPNSFQLCLFSSFQTLDWMLQVHLYIQNFQFNKLFITPPDICRSTLYTTKIVEKQSVILILNVIGEYKNI